MKTVKWNHPDLAVITRLMLKQSRNDESVTAEGCTGKLKDGTVVAVEVPFIHLPKSNYHGAMLDYARKDGVHLKGLGIFNGAVISLTWRKAS